jgi:hypothetical protein
MLCPRLTLILGPAGFSSRVQQLNARMAGSLKDGGAACNGMSLATLMIPVLKGGRRGTREIEAPIITTADFASLHTGCLCLHGNDGIGISVPPTFLNLSYHMAFPTLLLLISTSIQKHREGSRNVQNGKVCRQFSAPSDVNCCFDVFSVVRNNISYPRLDLSTCTNSTKLASHRQHLR